MEQPALESTVDQSGHVCFKVNKIGLWRVSLEQEGDDEVDKVFFSYDYFVHQVGVPV